MNSIETLTEFLGWCTVINIGILMFSTIMIVSLCGPISRIHARMFKMEEEKVRSTYFTYLGQFKIAVIVFNLGPYLALTIMG